MNLSKRQVKALLDVMSSDDTRPGICQAWVDERNGKRVLVAVDGYHLVALNTELDSKQVGKVITREDLTKWYKQATAKDSFTDKVANDLLTERLHRYPDNWTSFIPTEPEQMGVFTLNARYLTDLETVNDYPLTYKTYGRLRPFIAETDSGLYIIMPIKD